MTTTAWTCSNLFTWNYPPPTLPNHLPYHMNLSNLFTWYPPPRPVQISLICSQASIVKQAVTLRLKVLLVYTSVNCIITFYIAPQAIAALIGDRPDARSMLESMGISSAIVEQLLRQLQEFKK